MFHEPRHQYARAVKGRTVGNDQLTPNALVDLTVGQIVRLWRKRGDEREHDAYADGEPNLAAPRPPAITGHKVIVGPARCARLRDALHTHPRRQYAKMARYSWAM